MKNALHPSENRDCVCPAGPAILIPGSVQRVSERVAVRTPGLSEQGDSAATRFERPAPVMFTRRCVGVVLLVGAGSLLIVHTSAQVNTNTLPAGAKDSAAETNQMPPLPTVKSPVAVFRDLLHM